MEADIKFELKLINHKWHVTINDIPLSPGCNSLGVGRVYLKCLKEGGLQSCWDAKEAVLDQEFKKRNEGR